jgi:hypothetical protein
VRRTNLRHRHAADAQPPQVQPWVVIVFKLLTPRGMSPQLTALWLRSLVWLFLFVAATLGALAIGVLYSGVFAITLAPTRAGNLKWPGIAAFALIGWRFVHFFPQVWQNRRDDKFPVIVVGGLILGCAWIIWHALAE